VRRLNGGMAKRTDVALAEVVGEEDNDVWRALLRCRVRLQGTT
jgi:hypothetical protein